MYLEYENRQSRRFDKEQENSKRGRDKKPSFQLLSRKKYRDVHVERFTVCYAVEKQTQRASRDNVFTTFAALYEVHKTRGKYQRSEADLVSVVGCCQFISSLYARIYIFLCIVYIVRYTNEG